MALDKAVEEVAKSALTAGVVAPADLDAAPKGSFWAKFGLAWVFSAILAKLSLVAAVFDLNRLVGPELPLREKLKTAFSVSKLKEKFGEHIDQDMKDAWRVKGESLGNFNKCMKEMGRSAYHIGRWTVITWTVTTVIGSVMGWTRGNRIQKASDLIHHPWQSTKIILGLEDAPKTPNNRLDFEAFQPQFGGFVSQPPLQQWQERVGNKPQPSHTEAVLNHKESEPLVPGM